MARGVIPEEYKVTPFIDQARIRLPAVFRQFVDAAWYGRLLRKTLLTEGKSLFVLPNTALLVLKCPGIQREKKTTKTLPSF